MRALTAQVRRTAAITVGLGFFLLLIVEPVVGLLDPHPPWWIVIRWPWLPEWIFAPGLILKLILRLWLLASAARGSEAFGDRPAKSRKERRGSAVAAGLTNLAVLLAGRRRAHVRDAWLSDLDRPRDSTDDGVPDISGWRRLLYAAGFVKAAIRYRLDDVAALYWQLADAVLASRSASRLLLGGPCVAAAAMIVNHDGFYGLVANAENLLAIGSASAGLVYGGRKIRKVTPKPTRQKQGQT
jgi:hypothetical protein